MKDVARIQERSFRRQEGWIALTFILPFMIGFLLFSVLPILFTVGISFMDFNSLRGLNRMKFTGLDNFLSILRDPIAMDSYFKSFYYTLMYVPGVTVLSLLMAILMNQGSYFRKVSRTMIIIPYVSNIAAVSMVFIVLLNPFDGVFNNLLRVLGFTSLPLWLGGIHSVLPTIAATQIWQNLAFQTIIFLAALQSVPSSLYESAVIDGAGVWRKFRHITLPMISPTTFFIVITSILTSFQNYAPVKLLTNGGPGTASRVIAYNIYEEAFTYNRYSYASAQALVLFGFIFAITILQWKGQKRWVHY